MNPIEMRGQAPTAPEVRAALERIVSSPGFANAGRLASFLRHAVQAVLAGEQWRLKESVLGVEVFARDASYDPRIDPVVRVEARRLRARLDDYYEGAGKDDPVRIHIPKGGYVPFFEHRQARQGTGPAAWTAAMPRLWRPAAIFAMLAAAGIGLGWWQTVAMRKLRQAPLATVAVIPFKNAGGEAENEYFSQGLSEEILNLLARTPGIRVISRSVIAQYGGKPPSLDEVAARLQASMVVEGSVRRQGRRLRVTARLVRVKDGSLLWSEAYERRMEDVFAIQDEIARSISAALRIQTRFTARRAPSDIEAYHLYLRGRQQLNLHSAEGMQRAIGYFEQATTLAPEYAPAYAALSMAHTLAAYFGLPPQDGAWRKAQEAARRAIALDPSLGEAHAALGFSLAWEDWNWPAAEASFRRALETDDSSALVHGLYAVSLLLPDLRLPEARQELRRALEIDPLLLLNTYTYAFSLLIEQHYGDAARQYERVLETKGVHPDVFWNYGMALGFAGRPDQARAFFRRARQASGEKSLEPRGLEAFFSGDLETARRDAPLVEQAAGAGREAAMDAARLFAMLGDKEKALRWLDRAIGKHEAQALWIQADPRLANLRGDPRHAALVRRIGLHPR